MITTKYINKLVGIKSFMLDGNSEIIDFLANEFGKYAKEIVRLKNKEDNRENLIIGLNTDLKNVNDAIILAGHIDTVTANEKEYKTNPYIATTVEDKIFGLGVIDMKSFFAVILDEIEKLKKIKSPLIIVITGDEETTFNGVNNVYLKLKELNIVPKFSIVGEPTSGQICYISKSCNEYEINIIGKSCHSSMPSNGINANYILSRIALYIEKLNLKYENTTLSANIISGGNKVNIISDNAKLVFDLRSNFVSEIEEIKAKINKYLNLLTRKYLGSKATMKCNLQILPLENKNFNLTKKISRYLDVSTKEFTGGCEAGYYQKLGGDAIVFGVGDLALAHKPNEYVVISEFEDYQQKLLKLIHYID